MIAAAGLSQGAAAVDIGAGASALAGALLVAGFGKVTALDISGESLNNAQAQMGKDAKSIDWVVGDARTWTPDRQYDLWHDRAAYHFLIEEKDRQDYLATMDVAVRPGGRIIIAGFALDGPEKCSGLPVRRHSEDMFASEFGRGYELRETRREVHVTPKGGEQPFIYCQFEKL